MHLRRTEITGAAYLYDYLNGAGYLVTANSAKTLNLTNGVGYFVLVAVGKSGIAFLGDKESFVTLGKKRIPVFAEEGQIDVGISFAKGEHARTLFGYSPHAVTVAAIAGAVEETTWDPASQLFTIRVHGSSAGLARLLVSQSSSHTAAGSSGVICETHWWRLRGPRTPGPVAAE